MKIKFIIFVLIAASIPLLAQDGKKPEIVFNNTVHDFGKVLRGEITECSFVFYNKGNAPLIITNVKAACGCTVPEWPKEPIMPGKSGNIKVKYNSNTVGVFDKTISIYTNVNHTAVNLSVKGEVVRSRRK